VNREVLVRWLTAFLDFPAVPVGAFELGCSFWQAVTAYALSPPRGRSGEFATLLPLQGDAYLRVQRTGCPAARCHLDLHVDNVEAALERAVELGASATGKPAHLGLTSPGGLPFCVVKDGGEAERPPAAAWPGGGHSLVDQLCLDISPQVYERECAFWSALTGWERRPGSRPEGEYLARPPAMPLRLLLQRLDDSRPGPCRAHLDLACDDVPAESARHQALGAIVVNERPNWTALLDPTGLVYCVTGTLPSAPPGVRHL
jgi:predicted enzyme related to lactoylglutathione lyase